MYEKYGKRLIDIFFSLMGLIFLSPLFLVLAVIIRLDSPGPAFFGQKRVGIHKTYFYIHKFRTMNLDAPRDVPTHLMKDTERYTTGVGRFIRKYSLDELPQLYDILIGRMSMVGPRPALWNQEDLVAERDKYGANDVRPGLTGWAQINGRDELDIVEKSRLDGEYVRALMGGHGLSMDVRCLFRTISSVLRHDGVVEGPPDGRGTAQ